MKRISYVIPCYGSEKTIETVINDIIYTVNKLNDYDYEIVLINDCSPDNLWAKIVSLCKANHRIKAINFTKNFGQHSALMAGYSFCTGDYIVTLDDDGQTPVDQVPLLLNEILKGYDVVYAKYEERKDSLFRKFGTSVNNLMLETLVGKPKNLHLTSFFIARDFIIKEICSYNNPYPYIWGLILRTTRNISNVLVKHSERKEGKSGYTLIKLLNLWFNGFTAFSITPLRVSSALGVVFTFFGFIGVLYTIINKIVHPDILAGYSSLMSVLLIVGGIVMTSLGLIGEYVGRIYMCINNTPQYVIKDTININETKNE